MSCLFRLELFQPSDLSHVEARTNSRNVKFTLGEIRHFIIRKLHSLDDIFEALAGGVEGDMMGHGKAIGGGGRGVSSRSSIHALFEAEDGQRSLGFVATDDLQATLTKPTGRLWGTNVGRLWGTFGRLRRFGRLGRFGRFGQLPFLSSACPRTLHVLDLKAKVDKAVLLVNVGTMGVVEGVTAVLGVRCVEDLSGSPMAVAVFSGTHMGSEVEAVTVTTQH